MREAISFEVVEVEWTKKIFPRLLIFSFGAILAITGIAKIWSGFGNSKFLAVVDPVIGIKFGQLMLAVAMVEVSIALVCFFSKRQTMVLALVAWLRPVRRVRRNSNEQLDCQPVANRKTDSLIQLYNRLTTGKPTHRQSRLESVNSDPPS